MIGLVFGFLACFSLGLAQALQLPRVEGIDSMGLISVAYQGEVYHMTVGDQLDGLTIVAIVGHEVIARQGNNTLQDYHF